MVAGRVRRLVWNNDSGGASARLGGTTGRGRVTTEGAQAYSCARKNVPIEAVESGARRARACVLRLLILALFLLPGRVSLSNSLPPPADRSIPSSRLQLIFDEPLGCDCLAHLDHSYPVPQRHSEKRPAALRKHSRFPSPSDDDGTRPDPTDEDESSDNMIGDGTEAAVVSASPPVVCFLMIVEESTFFCSDTSQSPLFLVLQRFRC